LINTDHIISVYEDLTADKIVAWWSTGNFWHVEETIEQVYSKLGLEYKHKKEEVN
jgi:hypothetical protein